jgi:hypothetical protein
MEDNDMLVTFTTKAYANITMFGDVAVTLLKMMGHSAPARTQFPFGYDLLSSAHESGIVLPG